MKFRDLVEGKLDKKLLAAAEKLIIKMKKDKEHNNKIIKALEINFPSLDALDVLSNFKNARVDESHFEIGDDVICKTSGFEGKIVKIDEPEEGAYYSVELEDGTTKKYAPEELSLVESQDAEYVLQSLADADINASIDGNIVMVDKSDVRAAQKVLKEIGCSRKVKAGLNEGEEDVIFSKTLNGQELKVHVHDGKFVIKIDGVELK